MFHMGSQRAWNRYKLLHHCDRWWPRNTGVPDDKEVRVYVFLTPAPYGDSRLVDALAKFDKGITLCGNIDQMIFLRMLTQKNEVRRVLEKVKQRGNFILATTDYFSEVTPYENMRAFAEAGLEYGRYD